MALPTTAPPLLAGCGFLPPWPGAVVPLRRRPPLPSGTGAVRVRCRRRAASAASSMAAVATGGEARYPLYPAPLPPAVLTMKNMSYTVPTLSDTPLFTDVCLSLHESQLLLLIGANGCGKSTLLSLLAGFRTPTSRAAVVTLGGVAYRRRRRAARVLRESVGMVPQRASDAFLGRSVLEELTLFREDETTPEAVRSTLGAVGLGDISLLARPTELSGGQQRRLALASQLLRQPRVRVLLLDEPLAGVDGGSRRGIAALLGAVKQVLPVAVVTHQPGELLGVADRVLVVGSGGVTEVPRDVVERARAIRAQA